MTIPAATEQVDYADLYARWERGNWSATAIDLSQDRVDWRERLTPEQRRGALWLYTLFLHGEDSVAVNLSPYIDADDGLRATQAQLTWGHRKTFGRLDRMAAELRSDRSPRMLAKAIAMYHVVVEGTLAQPGQHIIETSLNPNRNGAATSSAASARSSSRCAGIGIELMSDVGPSVLAATASTTMPATIDTAVAASASKPKTNGAAMNRTPAPYSIMPCR